MIILKKMKRDYCRTIEEDVSYQGNPKKEWRTLRCLLRKYLKVPRRDVNRLKKIGINSVQTLLRIHYTMIPDLWERLRTNKGPQVKMVAWFCYWAQEIEYDLEDGPMLWACYGHRPGPIADDVVERFDEWRRLHREGPHEKFPYKEDRKREEERRGIALVAAVNDPEEIIFYKDGLKGPRTWTQEEAEAARIREQQQALFEVSMLTPQPDDGFEPDEAVGFESAGEETDREDEERSEEFSKAEDAFLEAKRKEFLEETGHDWVRSSALGRRLILTRIMNAAHLEGPEGQDDFIKEIHYAVTRAKRKKDILAAYASPADNLEWQHKVMRAFFFELEDPDSAAGWQPPDTKLWGIMEKVGFGIHDPVSYRARDVVEANVAKVKLQVERFNAAVAGRLAWIRAHGDMTEVPEYAAIVTDIPKTEDVPEPAPKRFRGGDDTDLSCPGAETPSPVPPPADD